MAEKKVSLSVRLFPEEKMRIKRCARETGQNLSEYVMTAVRERLKRDETPPEDRSDIDLMQQALTKITGAKQGAKSTPELEDKSLMDLIGEYVDKDE